MLTSLLGVLDSSGTHIDISKSLAYTKHYATLNGYTKISRRVGYNGLHKVCSVLIRTYFRIRLDFTNITELWLST